MELRPGLCYSKHQSIIFGRFLKGVKVELVMSAPNPKSKRDAGNKTQLNDADVSDFLNSIEHEQRRHDAVVLIDLMESITGFKPKMWGQSIIGFDQYHYKYDSGREGDLCLVGFSPRARALSLYIMPGFSDFDHLLDKLGKFRKWKLSNNSEKL